jgi:hypothetical protein
MAAGVRIIVKNLSFFISRISPNVIHVVANVLPTPPPGPPNRLRADTVSLEYRNSAGSRPVTRSGLSRLLI